MQHRFLFMLGWQLQHVTDYLSYVPWPITVSSPRLILGRPFGHNSISNQAVSYWLRRDKEAEVKCLNESELTASARTMLLYGHPTDTTSEHKRIRLAAFRHSIRCECYNLQEPSNVVATYPCRNLHMLLGSSRPRHCPFLAIFVSPLKARQHAWASEPVEVCSLQYSVFYPTSENAKCKLQALAA